MGAENHLSFKGRGGDLRERWVGVEARGVAMVALGGGWIVTP